MKVAILSLFFILLLGSIYFSLERVLYSDTSYILFQVINMDSLQPQVHRYGSFITQCFPLFAAKLHLPLPWIVMLYSASFNLFYLAVAAILILKLKEYSLAILMSLYFTLFVSDTFYWPTNEIHQAITWMFLFFGLTVYFFKRNTSRFISIPILSLLAFLSIYTHPLVLFPFLFLWLFYFIENGKQYFKDPMIIVLSVIIILIFVSKFFTSITTPTYDYAKLNSIRHLSVKTFWSSFNTAFTRDLFRQCLYNYWIIPLLILAGFYSGFQKKKHLQLSLALVSSFGYFIAMCITYKEFLPFYSESQLMPATIIISAPFVYYTLPSLKPKIVLLIVSGIFIARLAYIANASEKFIERKNWLFSTLKNMKEKNIKKAYVDKDDIDRPYYLSDWSTPQESMIASALAKDKPQLTFIVAKIDDLNKRIPKTNRQMLGTYIAWDIQSLNNRYFSFDTTVGYQKMTLLPNSQ